MMNVSVLEQAGVTNIEAMMMRRQLCWAGHISMMEDHHLPEIVLCDEITTGCHKRWAPKRRYKDSLKQYLSLDHIDSHQCSTLASNRDTWRDTIHSTAASVANTYRISFEEKRQCRKNRSSPISPKETFCSAFCDRICLSHIGRFSHQPPATVGSSLPKSSFTKPSHDDDDDDPFSGV
ncbi:hypothetical protein WISP_38713 [Willisornis vidua]|uniref:Uncharacterized protein n=1 Tax=Willisornis vidua TaxID=1566151 RepID=A0ABQ9DNV4_9PASS|nr:hypothetical protein WISP_38713 [Willisornis vidua]